MLTNLTVRSNLIENCRTPECCRSLGLPGPAPLARLSAMDLHELSLLNPMWPKYLDVNVMERCPHGLPTFEQREQWRNHLFYGDSTITLSREREQHSWLTAARELCLKWPEIRQQLTLEVALECCCILTALKDLEIVHPEKEELENIKSELTIILNDYHTDIELLFKRSRDILLL